MWDVLPRAASALRPCPGLLSFAPPGLSNSCQFVKFVSYLASWRLCVKISQKVPFCRFPGGGTGFPVAEQRSRSFCRVSRSLDAFPAWSDAVPARFAGVPGQIAWLPGLAFAIPCQIPNLPVWLPAFPVARPPFPFSRTAFPPGWTPFPVKMTGVPVLRTPFPHDRNWFPVGRSQFPERLVPMPPDGAALPLRIRGWQSDGYGLLSGMQRRIS